MKKIIHNRIRCKNCGDIIESKSLHDFVVCSCGACFTDGGHDYIRRGWDSLYGENEEDVMDYLDEYEEIDDEQSES